jgi:hypothetical protein
MTQSPHDLDALIAGARQAPPTPSAEIAAQGWSRLRGQLGAVVVAPQIDLPPGLVESAAAGKSVAATAASWGWFGKAIASAAVTVTVGVGIAAVGPGRADPPAVTAVAWASPSVASPSVASPSVASPSAASPSVAPAELPVVVPAVSPTPVAVAPAAVAPVAVAAVAVAPERVVDPPKAAPTRRSAPAGGVDVEAPLISAAVQALSNGDADRALEILATHRRRFPAGVMGEDREAVRIFALCRAGRDATSLRAEFLRRWPSSPHAPKVRDACSPAGR